MADETKIINEEIKLRECADENEAQEGLRVGATIDEFVIEHLLGRGGASEVYSARDTRTESAVAIKFLLPGKHLDKKACARLRNEAKHIMELRHRHIVSVIDVREHESAGPYIVMELLEGKPLTEHVPMPEKDALEVCAQVAEALAYAHGKGMIHRDIKPSNVMMLADGTVRVVDFGLAKAFAQENPQHIPLTRTTEVVGTPLYMSPEQCFGQEVDGRSDVYQLGCLLFQCITGFPPFEGNNSFEAMFKHVSMQPDLHDISARVQEILTQALDKNADERFQTMTDMGTALRDAAAGRASTIRRKRKTKSPALTWFVAAASTALVLISLATVSVLTHQPATNLASTPFTQNQVLAQQYYEMGLDYKNKGWTEKSREALTKATQLDRGAIGFKALSFLRSHLPAHFASEEAEAMNIQGYNLAFASNDRVSAARVWRSCIVKYPDFEWPYSNLGAQYLDEGKPLEALPLLQKAVDINPYYTNGLRHMSNCQKALGRRAQAIEYMQRAADSSPEESYLRSELEELKRGF